MVKRCVAAACSKTYADNVSLFKFPRDHVLKWQWRKQVQRTRAKWSGPSEHSVLCSDHFTPECFEIDSLLAPSMGLDKRRKLKPDAVPSIFKRHTTGEEMKEGCSSSSAAACKRKPTAISSEIMTNTKKRRSEGYEKRERFRVCTIYNNNNNNYYYYYSCIYRLCKSYLKLTLRHKRLL